MHIPGVKQEQPDRRLSSIGPLVTDTVIRDHNNTRVAKMNNEDPRRVIEILNSLTRKTDDHLFVDTVVRDGNNCIVKKVKGCEGNKAIKVLNNLIRKSQVPLTESMQTVEEYTADVEAMST